MDSIYVFLNEYEQKTGIVISINEIGYETIWLYKDEVDEHFIPLEVLETLDEVVVASSVLYVDKNGDEYMRIAVQDHETLAYDKYVRWFLNNEPLDWEMK